MLPTINQAPLNDKPKTVFYIYMYGNVYVYIEDV